MKRRLIKVMIFLVLGSLLHPLWPLMEVDHLEHNGRWWMSMYLTLDYVVHVDSNSRVTHGDWRAGFPVDWIAGTRQDVGNKPHQRRVMPWGFVVNSLSWAAGLWFIWVIPVSVRRMRREDRIRSGLCPACAYPVGASEVCTECGGAVGGTRRA